MVKFGLSMRRTTRGGCVLETCKETPARFQTAAHLTIAMFPSELSTPSQKNMVCGDLCLYNVFCLVKYFFYYLHVLYIPGKKKHPYQ